MPDNLDNKNTLPPESSPTTKVSKKSKKNKSKKKGKSGIIIIVIIVLLIGGFATVLILDIGGFRENTVMPYLRNAPLIGSLIPDAEEDPLENITPEQLLRENTDQALQIEANRIRIAELEWELFLANYRIENDLMRYHDNWHLFLGAQAAFMQMMAHEAPHDFFAFFTQFLAIYHPSYLPELIQEAYLLASYEDEIRELVRTLNGMDESNAGEVLERFMFTNPILLQSALRTMNAALRASIFDTLDPNVAASMFELMGNPIPTFTPIVPQLQPFQDIILPTQGDTELPTPQATIPEPEQESEEEELGLIEDEDLDEEEYVGETELETEEEIEE